jgi:phage shock protein A
MGFFGRLARLIKSNLNDMINQVEDPAKMLNQIILDMNVQLVEVKKKVATNIAHEKRLAAKFKAEDSAAKEWARKAMLAVRSGDDNLAKEALMRKKEHEKLAASFQSEWEKHKGNVEQLKTALRALNNKIEEAKRKKDLLLMRNEQAKAMQGIANAMEGARDESLFDSYKRMEDKIEQRLGEAEASLTLNEEFSGDVLSHKFDQLEQTAGADLELEELKRSMGMLPGAEAPAVSASAASEESEEELEMAELDAALAELKQREIGGGS